MTEKPHISLQTIAEKAGVNRSTVSRALRNDPKLPLATRRRIQTFARELGYRPHPVVAALLAQVRARRVVAQRETLAFVTAFPTRDGWRKASEVFRDYYTGATSRAHQLGYQIEEFWAKEPGMTAGRLTRILRARNIRGLLIAPLPEAHGEMTLDWPHFAAATFGPSLHYPYLSRATTDHYGGFMEALRIVHQRGYRRIGLNIGIETDERINHAHLAVFYYHYHTIPVADRVPPLLSHGPTETEFRRWFRAYRPDLIFGAGNYLCRWLRKWGFRVPADVGAATLQHVAGTPYAGIDQQTRVIGAAVVDLVVGQLHRNEFGVPAHPQIVLIRGAWVDGETIRKAPG